MSSGYDPETRQHGPERPGSGSFLLVLLLAVVLGSGYLFYRQQQRAAAQRLAAESLAAIQAQQTQLTAQAQAIAEQNLEMEGSGPEFSANSESPDSVSSTEAQPADVNPLDALRAENERLRQEVKALREQLDQTEAESPSDDPE